MLRNPIPHLIKLGQFIVGAVQLTKDYYKPSKRQLIPATFGILLVVAIFSAVIVGIDRLCINLPLILSKAITLKKM